MVDRDGDNGLIEGSWRNDVDNNSAFREINRCGTNTSSRIAARVRDDFCEYFNSEGAISWQFN